MPFAAKDSAFKLGGTPVAFSNEATTKLTANTVYQITDSIKRVIDPAASVVVEVDADGAGGGGYAVADPTTYVVDFMFGKITFTADQGSAALVRVSGNYVPLLTFAKVTECAVSESATLEEVTNSDSAGWKQRLKTLDDVSGSVTGLELIGYDYDPGAGTTKLNAIKRAGTPLFLEHTLAGERFRAWVLLESEEVQGSVAEIARMTHSWQGTARVGANQTEDAVPTWEFP